MPIMRFRMGRLDPCFMPARLGVGLVFSPHAAEPCVRNIMHVGVDESRGRQKRRRTFVGTACVSFQLARLMLLRLLGGAADFPQKPSARVVFSGIRALDLFCELQHCCRWLHFSSATLVN